MAPGDVVLGASIDGYAVEGGYDVEGGPHTSFGVAQTLGRVRPSLRSSGTFEHLDELVDRAEALGLGELRLTVEWSRLERRPSEYDLDALSRYESALRAAARASMTTVVVLCDAAWPSWVGQEPWLSSWAPLRFAAYARWLAERLDGLVDTFVTFRAPNVASSEGWRTARRPPFRRAATSDAVSALDGMLVAHQRAVEAIAEVTPASRRAILFEVRPRYDDAELWRDLATGRDRADVLAARRRGWADAVPAGRGSPWALPASIARRGVDVAALRSAKGWSSCPTAEWWLGGGDVELLAVALHQAEGDVTTVELGPGSLGWESQLAVALPVLTAVPGELRAIHLRGLVSSTGPISDVTGLLDVDQHNGQWSVRDPDARLVDRLARRGV